jgi:hypothetical protein
VLASRLQEYVYQSPGIIIIHLLWPSFFAVPFDINCSQSVGPSRAKVSEVRGNHGYIIGLASEGVNRTQIGAGMGLSATKKERISRSVWVCVGVTCYTIGADRAYAGYVMDRCGARSPEFLHREPPLPCRHQSRPLI